MLALYYVLCFFIVELSVLLVLVFHYTSMLEKVTNANNLAILSFSIATKRSQLNAAHV